MTRTGIVVAAGGSSTRFGRNKLLADLDGLPLFCHCLRSFARLPVSEVPQMILVVPAGAEEEYSSRLPEDLRGRVELAPGGRTRTESVWNGVRALAPEIGIVAVQDAARPYATAGLLRRCIDSAVQRGSGIAAHRCTDTIKQAGPDGSVRTTLPRESLWAAETPQAFQRRLLEMAYAKVDWRNIPLTDDAQLLELAGYPTYLVENPDPNRKITYPADLPF